jgi:cyanophycin synthetase
VPASGQYVRLRYSANYSVGGSVRECMSELHPFNIFILEKAASLSRLDIVGIDVIAPSISEPLTANGGVICEMNGMPGVLPHMLAEPNRALMAEVANSLLGERLDVPLVAVYGTGAEGFIEKLEVAASPWQPRLVVLYRQGWRQAGQLVRRVDASKIAIQKLVIQDLTATSFLLQLDGRDLAANGLVYPQLDLLILAPSDNASPLSEPLKTWLCKCAKRVIQLNCLQSHEAADSVSLALTTAAQVLGQGLHPRQNY